MRTGSQVASPRVAHANASAPRIVFSDITAIEHKDSDPAGIGTKANQFEEGKEEEEEPVRIWGRFRPLEEGADLGLHPLASPSQSSGYPPSPFAAGEGIDGGDVVPGVPAGRIGRTGIETPVARVREN